MNPRGEKKEFYPKARMVVPDRRPYNLDQFLQLFFGEHPRNLKVKMAKALLEEIRSGMPRGWNSEEWINFILKVMAEDYDDAKALADYYESIRWTTKKGQVPKLLEAKCFELGLTEEGEKRARGRKVALFTIYRGTYSIVIKVLREAKILKKINGHYVLDTEFAELLRNIAQFYLDWRAGLVE